MTDRDKFGFKIDPTEQQPPPPTGRVSREAKRVLLILAAVVIGVPILLGGILGVLNPGSSGGAESACKEWVTDQLKAPATADFSNVEVKRYDDGRWRVAGEVDAENSFGATLRMSWSCYVGYDEDAETYEGRVDLD